MPIHSAYFILTNTERRLIRDIFIEVHTYAYTQCLLDTDRFREKANKRNIYRSSHICLFTGLLYTDRHREKANKRNIYRSSHHMPIHSAYFILTDTERRLIREICIEVHTYAFTQCLLHTDIQRRRLREISIEVHIICLYTVPTSY